MSNDDFERRLTRLFAETPPLPGEAVFAERVQERLARGESMRRLVFAAMGGLGAVVATGELLSANVGERLTQASAESSQVLQLGWTAVTRDASGLLAAVSMQTEVMWTVAGLGALVVALLTTRMADRY